MRLWSWLRGDRAPDLFTEEDLWKMGAGPAGVLVWPEEDLIRDETVLASSGGWCAPTSVIYDFMDMPKIQIKRGGIRHDSV